MSMPPSSATAVSAVAEIAPVSATSSRLATAATPEPGRHFFSGALGAFFVDVTDQHGCSCFGQPPGNGPAEALGASGYHRSPGLQRDQVLYRTISDISDRHQAFPSSAEPTASRRWPSVLCTTLSGRYCPVSGAGSDPVPHRDLGCFPRRSPRTACPHSLAGTGDRRRLGTGHAAVRPAEPVPVLGPAIRLGRPRGLSQPFPAVPHRHLRTRHSLPSRPVAPPRRPPTAAP